jgi:hypothetical protein
MDAITSSGNVFPRTLAEGFVSRVLVASTADNMLLTTVELGLIPAQRECSFPARQVKR